jgi:Ca2+/Na+ antiporter
MKKKLEIIFFFICLVLFLYHIIKLLIFDEQVTKLDDLASIPMYLYLVYWGVKSNRKNKKSS